MNASCNGSFCKMKCGQSFTSVVILFQNRLQLHVTVPRVVAGVEIIVKAESEHFEADMALEN